jgi:hypothetical protein
LILLTVHLIYANHLTPSTPTQEIKDRSMLTADTHSPPLIFRPRLLLPRWQEGRLGQHDVGAEDGWKRCFAALSFDLLVETVEGGARDSQDWRLIAQKDWARHVCAKAMPLQVRFAVSRRS